MFDAIAGVWATQHPAFYFATVGLFTATGFLLGLSHRHAEARRAAYADFVRASQRIHVRRVAQ